MSVGHRGRKTQAPFVRMQHRHTNTLMHDDFEGMYHIHDVLTNIQEEKLFKGGGYFI